MGLVSLAYLILSISGYWIYRKRVKKEPRPKWLRPLHYLTGSTMIVLVLILLTIGLVGTIGYYGELGHSPHLVAGLIVVLLVLLSGVSGSQISGKNPEARSLHITINTMLLLAFIFVSLTGWNVVQKYLP